MPRNPLLASRNDGCRPALAPAGTRQLEGVCITGSHELMASPNPPLRGMNTAWGALDNVPVTLSHIPYMASC